MGAKLINAKLFNHFTDRAAFMFIMGEYEMLHFQKRILESVSLFVFRETLEVRQGMLRMAMNAQSRRESLFRSEPDIVQTLSRAEPVFKRV